MLFITVTLNMCRLVVNDPPEFWACWYSAGWSSVTVISMPAIFSLWNCSIQAKASRFYAAAPLFRERIGNKAGIPHCFPRLNSSAVKFTAGVEKGRITAYAVDLQSEAIVQVPGFGDTGDSNTDIPVLTWSNEPNGKFMALRRCIVAVIALNIFLSLAE